MVQHFSSIDLKASHFAGLSKVSNGGNMRSNNKARFEGITFVSAGYACFVAFEEGRLDFVDASGNE
jgi:hypothetical protein